MMIYYSKGTGGSLSSQYSLQESDLKIKFERAPRKSSVFVLHVSSPGKLGQDIKVFLCFHIKNRALKFKIAPALGIDDGVEMPQK